MCQGERRLNALAHMHGPQGTVCMGVACMGAVLFKTAFHNS